MIMTDKKLTILGVVAAVMVVIVMVQSSFKGKQSSSDAITYLIQGLDMEDVAKIQVLDSNAKQLLISNKDGKFYVDSLSGYPVKISELNNLITKCLDVKIGAKYTDNVSNFDDLEISDEKAKYIVKFLNAEDKVLTGIIVGANKNSGNYVRKFADRNVYISENSFWASTTPTTYVESKLFDVKSDDITEVSVATAESSYKIINDGTTKVLEGIPEGKQAKDSDLQSIFDAIGRASMTDAAKQSDMTDLSFDTVYNATLKNSTVYRIELAKKGSDFWIKCAAVFTNDEKVKKANKVESDQELKKKEQILLDREAAMNFTAKHKGWVYKIPSWVAGNMTKEFDSLLEDVPVDEAEVKEGVAEVNSETAPAEAKAE